MHDLSGLKRRDLQDMAKQHGIKANMKTVDIIAALTKELEQNDAVEVSVPVEDSKSSTADEDRTQTLSPTVQKADLIESVKVDDEEVEGSKSEEEEVDELEESESTGSSLEVENDENVDLATPKKRVERLTDEENVAPYSIKRVKLDTPKQLVNKNIPKSSMKRNRFGFKKGAVMTPSNLKDVIPLPKDNPETVYLQLIQEFTFSCVYEPLGPSDSLN